MKILFDYNRTLFNPEANQLYSGVRKTLAYLADEHELFLVTSAEVGREERFVALDIEGYFQQVYFVARKTPQLFATIAQGTSNVLVVGDRLAGEIRIGNQLGFTTVRVKQGLFSTDKPKTMNEQPSHTIDEISDLVNLIKKL